MCVCVCVCVCECVFSFDHFFPWHSMKVINKDMMILLNIINLKKTMRIKKLIMLNLCLVLLIM